MYTKHRPSNPSPTELEAWFDSEWASRHQTLAPESHSPSQAISSTGAVPNRGQPACPPPNLNTSPHHKPHAAPNGSATSRRNGKSPSCPQLAPPHSQYRQPLSDRHGDSKWPDKAAKTHRPRPSLHQRRGPIWFHPPLPRSHRQTESRLPYKTPQAHPLPRKPRPHPSTKQTHPDRRHVDSRGCQHLNTIPNLRAASQDYQPLDIIGHTMSM
jgi:hypothetical protein